MSSGKEQKFKIGDIVKIKQLQNVSSVIKKMSTSPVSTQYPASNPLSSLVIMGTQFLLIVLLRMEGANH